MEPLLLTIDQAQPVLGGIGRSKIFELIANGELPSVQIGRRRFVTAVGLQRYVASLAEAADTSTRAG